MYYKNNFLIGGEFEFEPSVFENAARNIYSRFQDHCFSISGRVGIRVILQSLKKKKKFLLPSYLCDSIVQPFKQEGVTIKFYPVKNNLNINISHLNKLISSFKPDGILFVNYFGFPPNKNEKEFLLKIKEKLTVIEDCTHGSLLETKTPLVGDVGHYVVTSFRKYLPVPDGALVINKTKDKLRLLKYSESIFFSKRLLAKIIRTEFIKNRKSYLEYLYLKLFREAEEFLDSFNKIISMSNFSKQILIRLNFQNIMERRRHNFLFILKEFLNNKQLKKIGSPLYNKLPDKVSPFLFPVRVLSGKRDQLQKKLRENNIFCPIIWPVYKGLQLNGFEDSFELSQNILCFPIDQRYLKKDMEYIINKLKLLSK